MAKPLQFRNAVLCEHIVRGEGNKVSLINVYSGDIVVTEFPARIFLSLFLEHIAISRGPYLLDITLILNGKPHAKIGANVTAQKAGEVGSIVINSIDLVLQTIGTIEFTAEAKKAETVVISKKILAAP